MGSCNLRIHKHEADRVSVVTCAHLARLHQYSSYHGKTRPHSRCLGYVTWDSFRTPIWAWHQCRRTQSEPWSYSPSLWGVEFHISTAKSRAYYWNTGCEPNCLPFRFRGRCSVNRYFDGQFQTALVLWHQGWTCPSGLSNSRHTEHQIQFLTLVGRGLHFANYRGPKSLPKYFTNNKSYGGPKRPSCSSCHLAYFLLAS